MVESLEKSTAWPTLMMSAGHQLLAEQKREPRPMPRIAPSTKIRQEITRACGIQNAQRADDGKGGVNLNDPDRWLRIATLKSVGPGYDTVCWKAASASDLDVAHGFFQFIVA